MTKKLIFLALVLWAATTLQAQLLWQVSGNGLEKPSYIFGTHHLAPLSIIDSIPDFRKALNAADMVVGELDNGVMNSPQTQRDMMAYVSLPGDSTMKHLMSEEDFGLLCAFLKENMRLDLPASPFMKMKPAMLSNLLTMVISMKYIEGGFNPALQLDATVQNMGKNLDKKTGGLETAEQQFELLFNSTPLLRQAENLMCMVKHADQQAQMAKRMVDTYMSQNLQALYDCMQTKLGGNCDPTPEEMAALLDNRNLDWAARMPQMMAEQPVFYVVGAGHLSGDKGVINLLREKGFTVEPVK